MRNIDTLVKMLRFEYEEERGNWVDYDFVGNALDLIDVAHYDEEELESWSVY